jgi:AhpD family alkylhydroperoxidase
MQARMSHNPMMIVPGALQAMQALQALRKAVEQQGAVPWRTIDLVQLRVSQINGCSFCVQEHARLLKEAGETDERLFAVAAWRDAPYFSDAERESSIDMLRGIQNRAKDERKDDATDSSDWRRGTPGPPGGETLERSRLSRAWDESPGQTWRGVAGCGVGAG